MALPSFCRETATVYRAPMVSERGTERRDWGNAVTHQITNCSIQPNASSSDLEDARYASTVSATGYLPPDADIQPDDAVEWNGFRFRVNGIPMPIVSATGAVSHMRVSLVEWRG